MDILSILSGLKGKVLDAAHFELLQSAYELQSQNISQLKENNEAIKESNALLNDKIQQLTKENEELQGNIYNLKSQIPQAENEISNVALALLNKCVEIDATDFYVDEMASHIPCTKMEFEAAIEELEEIKFLEFSINDPSGDNYIITRNGKKYILQLSSD